jgi:phage tail-like protein
MKDQTHQDRRSFLKAMGGTTAIAAAVPALFNPPQADAQDADVAGAAGAGARSFTSGKFAIELDGKIAGWLISAEGGHAVGDVVTEKIGPDHIQRKHIGAVKYEDITISCGSATSRALEGWVKSVLQRDVQRHDGAIVSVDQQLREVGRLTFSNAVITEIGFPALDAGSKDAAKLTVKFAPEMTRRNAGSGKTLAAPGVEKRWTSRDFKLEIDGLDCTHVNKIEALTVKQKVTENAVAEQGDSLDVAAVEIPNLVITLSESTADSFYDWHEDFLIRGNNGQEQEKGGQLTWLQANRLGEIGKLTFRHLGIFKLAAEKVEAASENIRRVKVEMYCEDMALNFGGSVDQ